MFMDFHKQAMDVSFVDDILTDEIPIEIPFGDQHHFLGLTPFKRFIVALILLMMTVILGIYFLLLSSKIALPFFG